MFTNIEALNSDHRLECAFLIMESLPNYYTVEGIDRAEMARAVSTMIGMPGSELEDGFVIRHEDEVIGVMTFIGGESLHLARLVGSQRLLKELSKEAAIRFRKNLKGYKSGYGSVPENSIYLSRFAVDQRYRGDGVAAKMMKRFLSIGDGNEKKDPEFSLHVDCKNQRAISFYTKQGFTITDDGDNYLTMLLKPQ